MTDFYQNTAKNDFVPECSMPIIVEWRNRKLYLLCEPKQICFAFHKRLKEEDYSILLSKEDVFPDDLKKYSDAEVSFKEKGIPTDIIVRLLTTKRIYRWCRITAIPIKETNYFNHAVMSISDLDPMIQSQKILSYQQDHDSLTGYANYSKFKTDAANILKNRGVKKYALCYCDIRNFKYINNLYGYTVGDAFIRHWADSLALHFNEDETFCHITADNFVALKTYHERDELREQFEVAKKLLNNFPPLKNQRYGVDLVIGVYCIDTDEDILDVEEMIDCANMAQKSVKYLGGSRDAIFSEKMREQVLREKAIESIMEQALLKEEFVIYLQGQVDIQHNYKIASAEALVRWNSGTLGFLPPNEFIPLFEKNGFIVKLDQYVFEKICLYIKERYEAEHIWFRIAVNVSRITMFQPNFIEIYAKIKNFHNIPDSILELECTESIAIQNLKAIEKLSSEIRKHGFLFSMDDFGAGESSLNALKNLSIDVLKLDRGFFLEGLNIKKDRTIIASIVSMANILHMTIVAEGVEQPEQVLFLKQIGCELVQGYVFAKPVPISDFAALELQKYPELSFASNHITVPLFGSMQQADQKITLYNYNNIVCCTVTAANDPSLEILNATQGFYTLIGYSEGQFSEEQQNKLGNLFINKQEIMQAEKELTLNKTSISDVKIRCRNGTILWLRQSAKYCEGNQIYRLYFDITAEKKLEQQYQYVKNNLSMLINGIPGVILHTKIDEYLTIESVNDKIFGLTGYTKNDIEQLFHNRFASLIHSADTKNTFDKIRNQRDSNHSSIQKEYRLRHKDGSLRWVSDTGQLTRQKDGEYHYQTLLTDITDIKFMAAEAEKNYTKLQAILNTMQGGIGIFESGPTVNAIYLNNGYYQMLGYSVEEYDRLRIDVLKRLTPNDREMLLKLSKQAVETKQPFEYTYRAFQKNGSVIWIQAKGVQIEDEGPYPVFLVVMMEVTELKALEQEFHLQMARYQVLEAIMQDSLFEYDILADVMVYSVRNQDGTVSHRKFQHYMKKLEKQELELPHPDSQVIIRQYFLAASKKPTKGSFEYLVKWTDEKYQWHLIDFASIADKNNQVIKIVGRIKNIHEDYIARLEMQQLAQTDALTGVLNKSALQTQIQQYLDEFQLETGYLLIMIDIDNFKSINDKYGHSKGDEALQDFTKLLLNCLIKQDIAGRFGGDEFILFLKDLTLVQARQRIIMFKELLTQNNADLDQIPIKCSIGAAFDTIASNNFHILFNKADIAMYQVKQRGKDGWLIYEEDSF